MAYPNYQQPYLGTGYYNPGMVPGYTGNQSPTFPQSFSAPRAPSLAGRLVSSPEEITVQDVPGDGSVGWFPSADGSCVYGKRWTADGTIQTVRFVPEQMEQAQAVDPLAVLSNKVDTIMQMLEQIGGSFDGLDANGNRNASKRSTGARKSNAAPDA